MLAFLILELEKKIEQETEKKSNYRRDVYILCKW